MTVISKGWDRLTLPGKIVFTAIPVLIALTVGLVAAIVLLGPTIVDILANNMAIVRFVVAVTIILLMTVPTAFLIIYMEMKIIALMNLRIGPDRVGPFGSLLSVVHGLKVLMKEDFTPTGADSLVFTLAPVVVYTSSVLSLLVIPFAPGLFAQDFNLALLYFFAVGSLGVVGLMMAGWSSFNKYSLLGGLRAAAQIISYEIPLTLAVVGVVLLAGTLSLNSIVLEQSGSFLDWYVFRQPLGFLIFFIAATAEGARTPFDLTEADSEIVATADRERRWRLRHLHLDYGEIVIGAHADEGRWNVASVAQAYGGTGSARDHMKIRDDVPPFIPRESRTRPARDVKHVAGPGVDNAGLCRDVGDRTSRALE